MTLHNRYIMQFLVVCAESFVVIAKECVNDQYLSYYFEIIFSRIKEKIHIGIRLTIRISYHIMVPK